MVVIRSGLRSTSTVEDRVRFRVVTTQAVACDEPEFGVVFRSVTVTGTFRVGIRSLQGTLLQADMEPEKEPLKEHKRVWRAPFQLPCLCGKV